MLSGSSGLFDFLGSKSLSFVDLDGELLGVNFISSLLLMSLDLEEVFILGFLSLSTSLKVLVIIESFLLSFNFLLLLLLVEFFLSSLKLKCNSIRIRFLGVSNNGFFEFLLKEERQLGEILLELGELGFVKEFHVVISFILDVYFYFD